MDRKIQNKLARVQTSIDAWTAEGQIFGGCKLQASIQGEDIRIGNRTTVRFNSKGHPRAILRDGEDVELAYMAWTLREDME